MTKERLIHIVSAALGLLPVCTAAMTVLALAIFVPMALVIIGSAIAGAVACYFGILWVFYRSWADPC